MRNTIMLIFAACWAACSTSSLKLTIPETFKQQATMQHVEGAGRNKMAFAGFTTSGIKKGAHTTNEGLGRGFVLQNLLLNRIGVQKNEIVRSETAKFRYTLTDGRNKVEVYADEL